MEVLINGLPIEAYSLCGCQCGDRCNSPESTFRPGHDARLISKLLKAIAAGELTIDQAARQAVTTPLAQKLRAAHQRAISKPAKAPKAKKSAVRTANTTVKVGRWAYPGIVEADGSVFRNTKTDGSGEWIALKGKAA
jgi:hypothetical protein